MKRFFWFLPFLCFLIGYYAIFFVTRIKVLEAPTLIGLSMQDAVLLLSERQLNARILAQKEDADIPEGTVLKQIPRPGQKIKPHQPVFLVVAKGQEKLTVPDLLGRPIEVAQSLLKKESIRLKQFAVTSYEPVGQVIGQWPRAGQELEEPMVLLYVSAGATRQLSIFPDLKGARALNCKAFLEEFGSEIEIVPASGRDQHVALQNAVVKDHKPLAGSLVDLTKPLHVRLSVERA